MPQFCITLREYLCDDLAADIGQAEIPALRAIGQAFVVDSKAVKNSCLQIVYVDRVFNDVVAVVVGFPERDAGLHPASGKPHGEAASVVVPPVVGRREVSLTVDSAAEFSSPNHQRGIKQAAGRIELDEEGLRAVRACTGMSRSTIYQRIAQGVFTRPVNLGGRIVAWPATEVAALNAARIAGKSNTEIRELVLILEAARTASE